MRTVLRGSGGGSCRLGGTLTNEVGVARLGSIWGGGRGGDMLIKRARSRRGGRERFAAKILGLVLKKR